MQFGGPDNGFLVASGLVVDGGVVVFEGVVHRFILIRNLVTNSIRARIHLVYYVKTKHRTRETGKCIADQQ